MRDLAPNPKLYQVDGIIRLATSRRALLLDDAGLGKSMQMIRAACAIGAKRVLIVCPPIAVGSWAEQVRLWHYGGHTLTFDTYVLGALSPGNTRIAARHAASGYFILPMSQISADPEANARSLSAPECDPFDVLIVDEAHKLANEGANRTGAVYGPGAALVGGIAQNCKRRWIATATPTPLNAGQLYPHLRALFPDVLAGFFDGKQPSREQFEDYFCDVGETPYGRQIKGNQTDRVGELVRALRPYTIRRSKAEVAPELGAIVTSEVLVETGGAGDLKYPTDFLQRCDTVSDDDFLALIGHPHMQHKLGDRQDERPGDGPKSPLAWLGRRKAPFAADWLADFLFANPREKVLVFARHLWVVDALAESMHAGGFGYRVIRGDTPTDIRTANVEAFQNDPDVRVFIGQMRAANTAVTLTAASTVLIVEPDPSPDENYQAISRAHRLGQKDVVNAYFLTAADDPIDRRLVRVLRRRAQDNFAAFGIETPTV